MADTLRTRIIAALARADQDWCSDNNLHEDMADAVIRELDDQFLDFALWLSEEITGKPMSRVDAQSCLTDWKRGADE